MIKEKSKALEKFKIFKIEVEKQLGKVMKVVRSDRGGEYYGRYDSTGQHMGPFAKYLQDYGIVPQYTMPGTPEQNGVVERRNETLKDMIRSMMNRYNLQEFLWGDALKKQPSTYLTKFLVNQFLKHLLSFGHVESPV